MHMYHGDETITMTLSKEQLMNGVFATVYTRNDLGSSQAMHGITARLWEYLAGLNSPDNQQNVAVANDA